MPEQNLKTIYFQPEVSPSTECPIKDKCHNLTALGNNNLLTGNVSDITIALLPGIHTYNGTSGVIEISNAIVVELVAVDESIGSTVICCNKTKSVQIDLRRISNVTIRGIEIENCGVSDTFTLAISYSNTVTI